MMPRSSLAMLVICLVLSGCYSGRSKYKDQRGKFLAHFRAVLPAVQRTLTYAAEDDAVYQETVTSAVAKISEVENLANYKQDYLLIQEAQLDVADAVRCRLALQLMSSAARASFGSCYEAHAKRLQYLAQVIEVETERNESGQ